MKKIFYDVEGKLSFGRILSFASMILGIGLFFVAISYNWYEKTIQSELFDLVKWMFAQGGVFYTVSKGLDSLKK